jgi:tetratricopeptide (TPR) repeat protein
MNSIFFLSISDRLKLLKVAKYVDNFQTASNEELIVAFKKAILEYPDEWLFYYFLGDKLQNIGAYAEAMHCCEKALKLKPNDVRTAYSIATCFNVLWRASFTKEEMQKVKAYIEAIIPMGDIFDPAVSQRELGKLGIDIQTAATRALQWFEYALSLPSDPESQERIKADIQTIHRRFPNLKR